MLWHRVSNSNAGSIRFYNISFLILSLFNLSTRIILDLEEIGINVGNWVDSAHDRNYWRALVNAALNLRVP